MLPSLETITWPVRTDRLWLRPARPDDGADLWRYRRLESVAEWISALPADERTFRESFVDSPRFASMILVSRSADHTAIIGDLMLRVENAWGQSEVADHAAGTQAEIGWAFDPEHHGKGYATEAVAALLRIAFEGLGLRRVTAECFAANDASRRLMERVGMRREAHHVADSLHRSGRWMDGLVYALLADEWRAAGAAR